MTDLKPCCKVFDETCGVCVDPDSSVVDYTTVCDTTKFQKYSTPCMGTAIYVPHLLHTIVLVLMVVVIAVITFITTQKLNVTI